MEIALFGGSFDPPHLGHITVADTVAKKRIADEVWFVPCANHPFAKNLSPAKNRLEMLQLIHGNHRIYTYEIEKKTASYSIETLEHATQEFPEHTFSWLIGSDLLQSFTKWHLYAELLQRFPVLVYPRAGYAMEPLLNNMRALHEVPEIAASATEVRKLVQEGKNIEDFVPKKIEEYIHTHRLYRL
jgi:nicotinate-nucleotide adenylyltransferase